MIYKLEYRDTQAISIEIPELEYHDIQTCGGIAQLY